jgi:TonB family protein
MTTIAMRAAGAMVLAAAVALATPASAAPRLRYYPEKAQKANMEGVAVLSCDVLPDGKLKDCTVVSEDPPGWGFGEAALGMVTLFKMRPTQKDGTPVESPVKIPITFRLPRTGGLRSSHFVLDERARFR